MGGVSLVPPLPLTRQENYCMSVFFVVVFSLTTFLSRSFFLAFLLRLLEDTFSSSPAPSSAYEPKQKNTK